MNNLFEYLSSVSLATTVLYLVFLLLFRKDTFYQRNRILLLLILLLPLVMPAIRISITNEIESTGSQVLQPGSFAGQAQAIDTKIPADNGPISISALLTIVYWAVSIALVLRLIIRVISTHRLISKGKLKKRQFPLVVETSADTPPFSFFPYVVIPSKVSDNGNYSDLLEHEFAHLRQGHTFDLILCELIIAFQWFNPVTWFLKKSVVLNNEYLADQASIRITGNKKSYQYRLLDFQSEMKSLSLAHNFNISIRERLNMINKMPTPRSATLKNILIIPVFAGIMVACATKTNSKTIIYNPDYESSSVNYVRISKIELKPTSTVIHFHVSFTPGWWIEIPTGTYIRSQNSNTKLLVSGAEGIPLGKRHYMPESGELDYRLIFPALDEQADLIDFVESKWIITGIRLKPEQAASSIPEEISGNWFNNSTGAWELSLFHDNAIYRNQVWSYEQVDFKNGKGSFVLRHDQSTVKMYARKKGNKFLAGESPEELVSYIRKDPSLKITGSADTTPFDQPLFREDTALYSGFIKGYKPEILGNSFFLVFKNLVTGTGYGYVIDIAADGSFSEKVPLLYPQTARMEILPFSGSVFLEPGKSIFQLIDLCTNTSEYSGESARLNYDLDLLKDVNSFDHNEMRKNIVHQSPEEYKSTCLQNLERDIKALDSITKEHKFCTKAYQIARMDMEYIYASHILDYDWYYRSAYREQNNLSTPVMEIPLDVEPLTPGYFDFLTEDLLNNPVGFYSKNYDAFLHSFKNIAITRPGDDFIAVAGNHSLIDLVRKLKIAGYPFSDEDQLFANAVTGTADTEIFTPWQQFWTDNSEEINRFFGTYADDIMRNFRRERHETMIDFPMVLEYLEKTGAEFSREDRSIINKYLEFEKSGIPAKYTEFCNKWGDNIERLSRAYSDTYYVDYYSAGALKRKANFQDKLGIGPCIAIDVMLAQNLYEPIIKETQYSFQEARLVKLSELLSNRFLADYFSRCLQERDFNNGIKF